MATTVFLDLLPWSVARVVRTSTRIISDSMHPRICPVGRMFTQLFTVIRGFCFPLDSFWIHNRPYSKGAVAC
ncbi:hypothetical protein EDD15DRAFT_2270197 [Pisolithus albus]|nr:hypothetical protein EDD15DRAFT_2270197 [Pisolithus albus]